METVDFGNVKEVFKLDTGAQCNGKPKYPGRIPRSIPRARMPTRKVSHWPLRPTCRPPRRIPRSKRDPLKKELDRMENVGIIEKVPLNEPADWVSSLVCVDKPGGSIRVCLDPRDLNRAIKREHYPLPLVEDITSSYAGATLFSTLDAEKAFYQIQLDEESSRLLSFYTPFGRYRYLRSKSLWMT